MPAHLSVGLQHLGLILTTVLSGRHSRPQFADRKMGSGRAEACVLLPRQEARVRVWARGTSNSPRSKLSSRTTAFRATHGSLRPKRLAPLSPRSSLRPLFLCLSLELGFQSQREPGWDPSCPVTSRVPGIRTARSHRSGAGQMLRA